MFSWVGRAKSRRPRTAAVASPSTVHLELVITHREWWQWCYFGDISDSQPLPGSYFVPVSCTFCGFVHLKALVLVFIILIKFTAKGRRLTEVDNSPKNTELVALKPEFEPRQSYTLSSSVWKREREREHQLYSGQGNMIWGQGNPLSAVWYVCLQRRRTVTLRPVLSFGGFSLVWWCPRELWPSSFLM